MNIVWIFVDSVRRYHSTDDRSRLEIMDKFSASSIEFTEVVTSAPSTVMSISAMMTGIHSFVLGTNYNDFRFNRKTFPTLTSLLSEKGWDCNAALMHPDIREKLTCVNMYPRNKWPHGYSHGDWWSNIKIYNFLANVLKKENLNKKPNKKFWFIDFNCRKDPNTSSIVEDTLQLFNSYGFTKSNTIFILCSDHGYPDPSKGITPDLLKKKKLTHDIFMTDDNIMIPFFISLPKYKVNKKYTYQISSLNIFPTILDYLNIEIPKTSLNYSSSLLDYLEENDGLHKTKKSIDILARSDARFLGQSKRVCCVRNKDTKIIYSYDDKKISYNIIEGLNEKEIKINSQNQSIKEKFKLLKNYLKETDYLPYQTFKKNFAKRISFLIKEGSKKRFNIFLFSNSLNFFEEIIISILNEYNFSNEHALEIKLVTKNKHSLKNYRNLRFLDKDISFYNLKIFLQTDNGKNLDLRFFKSIKASKSSIIPCSLTGSITQKRYIRAFKTIWYSRSYYLFEPKLIFKLFIKLLKNK